ncbi:hypothetical protein AB3472_20095 [Pseudomonas lurida]|uniref:hypothetical protein n=1 Tax=Pseudomonas lurida TaxID=244566 RepID=UPI0037C8648E
MERLNGWQRLWVIVGFLLAVGAVIVAFNAIETESHLMDGNKLDHAVHDMEIDTIQQRNAGIKPRNIYEQSSRTVAQAEERIRDIDWKYKQDLQELPAKQFTHIAILAGVWLGTCVSLYVMGWLIGWVIRGFRPKAA